MTNELTKTNQPAATRPRVDVFENAQEYLVIADLPGVAKEDLDVRFESGELRIEARRTGGQETERGGYRRAFAMPEGLDAEKIAAELAHGVLEVHLPKATAKRPRRIEINARSAPG